MTDEVCGAPTAEDTPCQHPAGENGRCHIPSHNPDGDADENTGRPSSYDEDKREAIYAAVGSGLKVNHVAGAAGVSADTLRRWTCCIDDLSQPVVDGDACDFCEGYARAHAVGAREVLEGCSDEFRASASFGYRKAEKRELENTGDEPLGNVTIDFTDVDT